MEGEGDATIASSGNNGNHVVMLPEAIQRLLHGHRVLMTLIPDDANCGAVREEHAKAAKVAVKSLGPPKEWRLQRLQEDALHAEVRVLPMPIDKRNEVWNLYLAMHARPGFW